MRFASLVLSALAGFAAPSLLAQSATVIFADDFESYAIPTINNQFTKSQGGKWWMIQNSVTSSGCGNVTPDQHKIVTTGAYGGTKAMRVYYDTMERWYEAGTGVCKWRAEAAERLGADGLATSGSVEVWYGFAVKPMYTNGNPWVKRCMGTTGSDVNCVGLRDNLATHVSQFLGDESGSKLIAVDIRHDGQAFTNARYFNVSNLGRVTDVQWNVWNTVIVHVKTGSAGFVECWINDVYKRFDGALWTATWTHDFKVGVYGDRVNDYAEVYFDNVKFAKGSTGGYDAVNPRPVRVSENFTSTSLGNFTVTPTGTNWAVANGTLNLTNAAVPSGTTPNANLAIHNKTITGPFTLLVDAQATATSSVWDDFSVVFDYRSATDYYFVSFNESNDGGTHGLFRYLNGTVTQLADFTGSTSAGTWHKVDIEYNGATLQVYLDSVPQLAGSGYAVTLAGGKTGVGTKNNNASFDNFIVE